jgi:hypothetical protein
VYAVVIPGWVFALMTVVFSLRLVPPASTHFTRHARLWTFWMAPSAAETHHTLIRQHLELHFDHVSSSAQSDFCALPSTVVSLIFAHLSGPEIGRTAKRLSWRLYRIASSPLLWKQLYFRQRHLATEQVSQVYGCGQLSTYSRNLLHNLITP